MTTLFFAAFAVCRFRGFVNLPNVSTFSTWMCQLLLKRLTDGNYIPGNLFWHNKYRTNMNHHHSVIMETSHSPHQISHELSIKFHFRSSVSHLKCNFNAFVCKQSRTLINSHSTIILNSVFASTNKWLNERSCFGFPVSSNVHYCFRCKWIIH